MAGSASLYGWPQTFALDVGRHGGPGNSLEHDPQEVADHHAENHTPDAAGKQSSVACHLDQRSPGGACRELRHRLEQPWSDGEAEDHCHHDDERRTRDEKGAPSRFVSERVPHVSFTFHFSFTSHCISDTPKGDAGI
jgi:hypothetical protein